METTLSNKPYAITWIAGVAVTLFSVVGIAAIMGWIPTSMSSRAAESTQPDTKTLKSTEHRPPATKPTEQRAAAAKPTEHRSGAGKSASDNTPVTTTQAPIHVATAAPVARAICRECGVVESLRTIETPGQGSGLGAVGGAVVGGVLGNQVGHGTGKTIATVAGVVGGAVAGNQIEKYVKKDTSYEITVRLEDGSSRMFHEPTTSSTWRAGDRVKIIGGTLQANS
jgi:outer membrane lipoprotein SlyB